MDVPVDVEVPDVVEPVVVEPVPVDGSMVAVDPPVLDEPVVDDSAVLVDGQGVVGAAVVSGRLGVDARLVERRCSIVGHGLRKRGWDVHKSYKCFKPTWSRRFGSISRV